jgi:hypothetical protein
MMPRRAGPAMRRWESYALAHLTGDGKLLELAAFDSVNAAGGEIRQLSRCAHATLIHALWKQLEFPVPQVLIGRPDQETVRRLARPPAEPARAQRVSHSRGIDRRTAGFAGHPR